jgi:ATP/maltotriose-dependent transcriptional regulator MalT
VAGFAEHAEAQAADDGGRLDDVAAEFERMGAYLLAADASAHAAAAHTRTGDRRRAAAATATAAALARECENARTPALSSLALPRLTGREAEVAGLAQQGMHNRAIAAHLVVSVRTVEAHLANAYSKLGISSRRQLADALLLSRLGNRSAPDNRTGGRLQAAVTVPTQIRRSREFSASGVTAWLRH